MWKLQISKSSSRKNCLDALCVFHPEITGRLMAVAVTRYCSEDTVFRQAERGNHVALPAANIEHIPREFDEAYPGGLGKVVGNDLS